MYAHSLPKHYSPTDIGLKLRYPAEQGVSHLLVEEYAYQYIPNNSSL